MADERFFNYYVEILNGTLQEALGKNIVYQTQARISGEDIERLKSEVDNLKEKLEKFSTLEQDVEDQNLQISLKEAELQKITEEKNNEFQRLTQEKENGLRVLQEEKDAEFQRLTQEKENGLRILREEKDAEIQRIKAEKDNELQRIKQERDSARTEASHIDTFRNELISARNEIANKNVEIIRLNTEKSSIAEKLATMESLENEINLVKIENSEYQSQLEELQGQIEYLKMTPAQRKKYDQKKEQVDSNIVAEDGGNF